MIRVLLADSRADRREQVRAALAADGRMEIVGQARDGQEAVQRACALRPDLVLLAADLSGRDGFAAAEMLASLGLPGESVLLTEGGQPDDVRRAMRAGARECVPWPCGSRASRALPISLPRQRGQSIQVSGGALRSTRLSRTPGTTTRPGRKST